MDEKILNFTNREETTEEEKETSKGSAFNVDALLGLATSNPEMIPTVVHILIEKYKPIVYGVMNELLVILEDYANNKKIQEINATADRNKYDAYVSVGFTEDQAFDLLMRDVHQSNKLSKEISKLTQQIMVATKNK